MLIRKKNFFWGPFNKGSIYKDSGNFWGTHKESWGNPGIVTEQLLLFLGLRSEGKRWVPDPEWELWVERAILQGAGHGQPEAFWKKAASFLPPLISLQWPSWVKTKWNLESEGRETSREKSKVEHVGKWTWRSKENLGNITGLIGEWWKLRFWSGKS